MKSFAVLSAVLALGVAFSPNRAVAAEDIETPKFELVQSGAGAELRLYAPMIAAEVRVAADGFDTAGEMGFMPLANYIFGNNTPGQTIDMTAPVTTELVTRRDSLSTGAGEKIAMTAPVTTAPVQEGVYAVRFMMPSDWTMETLPAPTDTRVALVDLPQRYVVVAGFTGPKEQTAIETAERAIQAFVAETGLVPVGAPVLAGYSAPFVPDAQKKWEVHLDVAPPS